jgi:hypothetical protein
MEFDGIKKQILIKAIIRPEDDIKNICIECKKEKINKKFEVLVDMQNYVHYVQKK